MRDIFVTIVIFGSLPFILRRPFVGVLVRCWQALPNNTDTLNQAPRLTFARYWAEQCKKMLAFESAHSSQCYRIYYERYATEPEKYLPPLFEFLGEPWDPEILNFSKKPHDFGLQDSEILETKGFSPSTGNYRKWDADEIATAKEVTADTMMKLGYEI